MTDAKEWGSAPDAMQSNRAARQIACFCSIKAWSPACFIDTTDSIELNAPLSIASHALDSMSTCVGEHGIAGLFRQVVRLTCTVDYATLQCTVHGSQQGLPLPHGHCRPLPLHVTHTPHQMTKSAHSSALLLSSSFSSICGFHRNVSIWPLPLTSTPPACKHKRCVHVGPWGVCTLLSTNCIILSS